MRAALAELGTLLQGPRAALQAAGATFDARGVQAAEAAVRASLSELCSLPDGGAEFFFEEPLVCARERVARLRSVAHVTGHFESAIAGREPLLLLHEHLAVALLAATDLQRAHAEQRRREQGLPPPPWARCRPVLPNSASADPGPLVVSVTPEVAERIPPRLARSAQRALLWATAAVGAICVLNRTPGCDCAGIEI